MKCEYNDRMGIVGAIVIQRNMLYSPMCKTTYNEIYNQTNKPYNQQ